MVNPRLSLPRTLGSFVFIALSLLSVIGLPGRTAVAQGDVTPLRVEEAVTGQLTTAQPAAVYSFTVLESLRMAVAFDVTAGDMKLAVTVLDQDQKTVLAGSTGPNVSGVVVTFPKEGTYFLEVKGEGGSSANYRLMVQASPALPINEFIVYSYPETGKGRTCAENTPAARFTTTEDLNVCYALDLIAGPTEVKAQWWSPSGTMVVEETIKADTNYNAEPLLTGMVYQDQAWEAGWWHVHFLINGELAHIQWVAVQ